MGTKRPKNLCHTLPAIVHVLHKEDKESSDDLCEIISSAKAASVATVPWIHEALIPRSMASSHAMVHVLHKEDKEDKDGV